MCKTHNNHITIPRNQPGKRNHDALAITNGACNPSGVARSLVQAIDEFHNSPAYRGTESVCNDPAIRLICHQLASLLYVPRLDFEPGYYGKVLAAVQDAVNTPAVQP